MGWPEAAWNLFLRSGPYMLPLLGALHIIAYAGVRRKPKLALGGVLLALFLVVIYQPLATILPNLSTDSFREGARFDLQEAWFYLRTLHGAAYGWIHAKVIVAWLAVFLAYAAIFVAATRFLSRRFRRGTAGRLTAIAVVLLVLPFVGLSAWQAAQGYAEASEEFALAERNFAPAPELFEVSADPANDLGVILYIGESTSRMHWSLYGYPRATTPALDRLAKRGDLMVFDHVTATFPHTSNSLLEALSLPKRAAAPGAAPVPIFEQQRLSLVDILAQAGIGTALWSNQARHGSWNLASDIVFRNARETRFSTSRVLGNLDYLDDARPYDDKFLARFQDAMASGQMADSRLLVFHSYAGHGPYESFLPPEARYPVDGFYRGLSDDAVFGRGTVRGRMDQLEAYDSAMRYISDSLARTIAGIDALPRPLVLVYFADHGESVFTGMGHDSARYTWPMGAVPFVMHFNPAAHRAYPGLVERYRRLATTGGDETLANLPHMLFDLPGVDVRYRDGSEAGECPFGSGDCLPRYLVVKREVDGGLTYVASPAMRGPPPRGTVEETGRVVAQYNLARQLARRAAGPQVCVHRNNSLARVIRARAVTDCLELDVRVGSEGTAEIYHPPAPESDLRLAKVFSALGTRPTTLWLDGKNLADPARCDDLGRLVARQAGQSLSFLVEFPSESADRLDQLRSCLARFERTGVARSYYVPGELGTACVQGDRTRCRQFAILLERIAQSGLFSDISFDYSLLPAVARIPASGRFRWNAWYVPDEAIRSMRSGRFRLLIPVSDNLNWN